MIENKLLHLPPLLQPEVKRLWGDYLIHAHADHLATLAQHPTIFNSLPKVWACSLFVANYSVQFPNLLNDLIISGDLVTPPENYLSAAEQFIPSAENETDFLRALRQFRRREMVRIAWRDLAGWASLEESFNSLSHLADALLQVTITRLYQPLAQQWGMPSDSTGQPQPFIVLAMGKLGGQELNFSSDIDLIFAYPEAGETIGTRRARDNQEFFTRLGQQLIHAFNHVSEEGFVFRVDMRLRPFGESGPLVMHFAAIQEYCQSHARDWERYAMIKARVAAGDSQQGQHLLDLIRPFVYRRYLDYHTFESLRAMKALINQESQRKDWENNIKLGSGGIREIEFMSQLFQLIRGGHQPALQQRHLLTTLTQLEKYQCLPPEVVADLREAYYFLRYTENRLQAIEDQQTQILPTDFLHKTRLAYSMGFDQWDDFLKELQRHRQAVSLQFAQIISLPPTHLSEPVQLPNRWQMLWIHGLSVETEEDTLILLQKAGFHHSQEILEHLRRLANSSNVRKMSNRGRERLDVVIPLLLAMVLEQFHPDETLQRTLNLMESITQRSVYLALLIERPQVLEQLVQLCAGSAWIAEQITRYPLLLDELLDPRRLYDPLKPEELDQALQAQLTYLPSDDLETQMDSMRHFKRAYILHVAAAEISDHLKVEIASDYLSAIADTLVRRALIMAWNHLAQQHGQPYCQDGEHRRLAGFCIIAYGKSGGIELNYNSDLDIIFLHDSQGTEQVTDGMRPLDNSVFFSRVARRIIHILSTNTPSGILYEVDPRLRPSGNSGLLVSSFEAFIAYQHHDAWTWEHQALVRARAIAGNDDCMNRFEQIRYEVLCLPREPVQLRHEVGEMRQKMRESLDKSTLNSFDLKQGMGGMTDIEFIAQYQVLRWANHYPDLVKTTGVLPLFNLLENHKLMDPVTVKQLGDAYRVYRAEIHRLTLQNQATIVTDELFREQRQWVVDWWGKIIEN